MLDIEERAKVLATYIIENKTTVRQTAKKFNISKSTVHKDISERLEKINPSLAIEAKKILEKVIFTKTIEMSNFVERFMLII